MYLFRVVVRNSSIEGKCVFAEENIPKGSVAWKFGDAHDKTMSQQAYDALEKKSRIDLRKISYVSPTSGMWVYPPVNDPACFTNHSETKNNLSAMLDRDVSSEPFFVANADIMTGEELVVNYVEFDESIQRGIPNWMK